MVETVVVLELVRYEPLRAGLGPLDRRLASAPFATAVTQKEQYAKIEMMTAVRPLERLSMDAADHTAGGGSFVGRARSLDCGSVGA